MRKSGASLNEAWAYCSHGWLWIASGDQKSTKKYCLSWCLSHDGTKDRVRHYLIAETIPCRCLSQILDFLIRLHQQSNYTPRHHWTSSCGMVVWAGNTALVRAEFGRRNLHSRVTERPRQHRPDGCVVGLYTCIKIVDL